MSHDEIIELLGAYALDAVDDDERAVVEAHLATCSRCRAEVAEHRETAALLAHGGGDAPEGVWSRIAGALEESPPRLRLAPLPPVVDPTPAPAGGRRIWPRLALVAAAAAAVVAVVLGVQVRAQDRRIDDLQVAARDPLAAALQDALDDPRSQALQLVSADGGVEVRGAITAAGVGYLRADDLPRLDGTRTYQLWGAAGDRLVSLGVLGADPGVVTFRGAAYDGFAITEEAAPGVVVTDRTPMVAGAVA